MIRARPAAGMSRWIWAAHRHERNHRASEPKRAGMPVDRRRLRAWLAWSATTASLP
jgi:hypothetical protein